MIYVIAKCGGENGEYTHIYPEKTKVLAMDRVQKLTNIGFQYICNIYDFNKRGMRTVMTFEGQFVELDSYKPQDL